MNDYEEFEAIYEEIENLEDFDLDSASRNITFIVDSEGEIPVVDIGLIFRIEE
jgi:hypothetical protein